MNNTFKVINYINNLCHLKIIKENKTKIRIFNGLNYFTFIQNKYSFSVLIMDFLITARRSFFKDLIASLINYIMYLKQLRTG